MTESEYRNELVFYCRLLYERRLNASCGGNMSVRVDEDKILITPSGKNKGLLKPEDLILMNLNGEVLQGGKPSMETGMHLGLYQKNPSTRAVFHCHPLNVIALTMNHVLRSDVTPEGVILLGDIKMVDYFTPGSKVLAKAVKQCSQYDVIVLRQHGAITQGRSLDEAYNRMEEMEFQAELQLKVLNCRSLRREEIQNLLKIKFQNS